jgi:virulence-associated protein VagC
MTRIVTSRTFRSGDGVAVRLPEEFALGEDIELELADDGQVITIRRKANKAKMTPAELVEALQKLPKPKHVQKRDPIFAPRRKGL